VEVLKKKKKKIIPPLFKGFENSQGISASQMPTFKGKCGKNFQ